MMNVQLPAKILNVISKQIYELSQKSPDGVEFIINPEDIIDIQADVVGPIDTPYEGGVFRCVLKIDNEFPNKPPKGYFLTKIFHPNIATNGEICVNTLKKDWDPKNWSIYHIFEVIKCLLIVPFPESSLNDDAARMFMDNYDEYLKRAKIYTAIHAKRKTISPMKPPMQTSENENNNSDFSKDGKKLMVIENSKEEDVLLPVTNSLFFENSQASPFQKQDNFGVKESSQPFSSQSSSSTSSQAIKTPASIKTDTKKKWMKRI